MTSKVVDGKSVEKPDSAPSFGLGQYFYKPEPSYADKMKEQIWGKLNTLGSGVDIDNLSQEQINQAGLTAENLDFMKNNMVSQDKAWYQDSGMLGSIAGLGSAVAQFAALPSQIDYAKTQTEALKQNIATAKEEQARRNRNISSFNAHRAPTSAFV